MNHIALWIFLAIGVSKFSQRAHMVRFMTGGLLLIALANTLYWNKVYDANLEHMQNVRMAAADFIRDSLPADERCAVFDIGAVRYFSGRPIIDIGGLTNPDLLQWFKDNKSNNSDEFLARQRVTCIVLPGQSGSDGEGWIDFVELFGLNDSPRLKLEQIASFEMDPQRWLLGYLPTANQQRSVVIYRILWTK